MRDVVRLILVFGLCAGALGATPREQRRAERSAERLQLETPRTAELLAEIAAQLAVARGEADPERLDVLTDLGRLHLATRDDEAAVRVLLEVATQRPGDAGVWASLSVASESRSPADAIAYQRRAVEVGQRGEDRLRLGLLLRDSDPVESRTLLASAVEMYEGAGIVTPDLVEGRRTLGDLWAEAGEPRAARAEYEAALKAASRLPDENLFRARILLDLARLYRRTGFPERALPVYVEALTLMKLGVGCAHPDVAVATRGHAEALVEAAIEGDGRPLPCADAGTPLLER